MDPPPPSSIYLHPAPFTSTQLISNSTQHSATPSTILELEYHIQLSNFLKFRPKNSKKVSVLTENWYTWYLGGVGSESKNTFSKFRAQIQFLGKFGPKSKKCLFCLKIGTHGISRMLIFIPILVFWISNLNPFLS